MKNPRAIFPTCARLRVWLMVFAASLIFGYGFIAATPAYAQVPGDMTIYTDSLQNGWQDFSWASHNLEETSVVQSGADAISVSFFNFGGLYFSQAAFNTSGYSAISFWVNGGTSGGQQFQIQAVSNGNPLPAVQISKYLPNGVPANQWVHLTIPLSDLGAANLNTFTGFWLQDTTGNPSSNPQPTLYIDQIYLVAAPPPSPVTVTVNPSTALQTVDERVFALNTAGWDGNIDDDAVQTLLSAAGVRAFRWPGGSWSDGAFHWYHATWAGAPMTAQFAQLYSQLSAQAFITADYGDGTPQSNAAWVAYCNAPTTSTLNLGVDSNGVNWQTAGYWASLRAAAPLQTDDGMNFLRANHPVPWGFKNWEFGNECYGSWENDTHTPKQDPVVYAGLAQQTEALMKQVDPTIKFGVVVTASEDDLGDQQETVTNPVTNAQHKGWTAVLFSALASEGMVPDFVIYHNYPQNPGGENDALLLQVPPTWTNIASSIRTMLNDYFGASAVANVQLTCTENNSVSFNPGKQTTSLVNGLYYADSVGSILQTEFHSLVWWDLHNGPDSGENNANYLYGWREYGDYGVLAQAAGLPGAAQDEPYPTYYALKLLSHFARNGDTIVPAASNYANLSAYACRQQNGNLNLLIINKNGGNSVTAQVLSSGYAISGTGTEYQYGIAQDTAQSQGQPVDLAQSFLTGVTDNSSMTFPPYSMSVVSFSGLAAPTNLEAEPSLRQIQLIWNPSSGATYYNVYRGTSSGNETLYQQGLQSTGFIDNEAASGTVYYYEVTAVNSTGESPRSSEVACAISGPDSNAVWIKQDSTTSGNWKGVYGSDGFNIFTDPSANNPTTPAYATVTPSGNSTFEWAAPAANNPAYCLQQAASGSNNRLAGVWYSTTNFSIDLNLTDGKTHQVALYLLDWLNAGRGEEITVTDSASTIVLDSRTITGFGNGFYEVYNLTGHVKISFFTAAGKNCVLSALFFDPMGSVPAAPTGLTATAGNAQINLSWTGSTGATSYTVYRSILQGQEGQDPYKTNLTGTTFTDTAITNGTTYYYQVTAQNQEGESGKSNEASATAQVPQPATPTGLTATAGNTLVTLSWNASAGPANYNIYRSISSGTETLYQSNFTSNTFGDSNVTNGVTYYYEVTAINKGAESGKSNEASATPQLPPIPNPPTGLAAIPGNQQIQLTWKSPGGAASYNLYRSTTPGGEGGAPIETGIPGPGFTDMGLTDGTTYYYQVTAVSASGESGKSNEASATPNTVIAAAVFVKQDTTTSGNWKGVYGSDGFNILTDTSANNPTTPAYATISPAGNSTFQWAAPAANLPASDLQQAASGSANRLAGVWYSATNFSLDLNLTDGHTHQVALYLLDFGSAGRSETIAITDANSGAPLSTQSVTGFGNGVYEVYNISGHVKITLTKTAGNNCVLSAFFFDPQPPPPAAPTGLTAIPGNGSVALSWSASPGATSYNVYRSTSSGSEVIYETNVNTNSFTDKMVTNGTNYFYQVTAVSVNGESGKSNEASATPSSTFAIVSFVKLDTTTSGNWIDLYGFDGFNVITDPSKNNPTIPSYATLTPTGNSTFQWAAPGTSNPTYCLQQTDPLSVGRVAGVWYSTSSFSLDLNMTDGNSHQFALYLLDWLSAGRAETITITDVNSGFTLDTRTVTGFGNGVYEVYNILGHVKITLTKTAGNNCVMSGYFFR